jgi:ubiquinone biosynthesis protein
MKLTAIPQLARNVIRLREILTVLSKYSLADWISRLDLDFARRFYSKRGDGRTLPELTHETRIRLALSELGPTFIKLGQLLSTRADLAGPLLSKELSRLQSDAPADPFPSVRATVEAELGQPLAEIFPTFEEKPLASASIAQVHRARLTDGRWVVVKVQHPDIEAKMRVDLDILVGLADLAEQHVSELRQYRPRSTAAEFQRTVLREVDFGREERNLQQFAANFRADTSVHFPEPLSEYSTSRVLTMELLEGIKLSEPQTLREGGHELEEIARRGATVFLEMIFRDGFYHADPHPGNVMVLPGGVIGLIDCGMVGRLDDDTREDIEEMLLAIVKRDANRLAMNLTRLGAVPPELDQGLFTSDIAEFLNYYASRSLNRLDLAQVLTELTAIIRRHHIVLPTNIAMLLKVLIMLEGTSRLLNPQFDMMQLIRPYQKKLVWRYLSPARRTRKVRKLMQEWGYLGEILPRGLVNLLQQLQHGRFEVHLEHKQLVPALNRLAYGLVTAALVLGSSLLLALKTPPVIADVSVIGAVSSLASIYPVLRLLWAISKSGRLD